MNKIKIIHFSILSSLTIYAFIGISYPYEFPDCDQRIETINGQSVIMQPDSMCRFHSYLDASYVPFSVGIFTMLFGWTTFTIWFNDKQQNSQRVLQE